MDSGHLIDMANQIGTFFASMTDRAEAQAGIADHLRRFWAPRMRRALLAALDDPAGEAAQRALPIVRETIAAYRDALTPAAEPA